tara:strand:+ start:6713 stop:6910 length:198 start_codon:yes stop_codon:yes gene_type:complete
MTLKIKNRIIREKERRYLTGVPPATWWRLEQADQAPKSFKIGVCAKGWLLSDIEDWISTKAGGEI